MTFCVNLASFTITARLWMHYICYNTFYFSPQHFLLGSGVLLMENGKNCFTMPVCDRRLYSLGAPSKLKNGEKRDIVQKGGRGLDQNPSFKLSRKNDMSNRREGGYDILSSF